MSKLIMYGHTASSAFIFPGAIFHLALDRPNTFLGPREAAEEFTRNHYRPMFEGVRQDGQRYWVGGNVFIFEHEEEVPLSNKEIGNDKFLLPDLDWLYHSLVNSQFYAYKLDVFFLWIETKAYREDIENKRKEIAERARVKLESLGLANTDDNIKLLNQVENFDHHYMQNDTSNWTYLNEQAKKLAKTLESFPTMKAYFQERQAIAFKRIETIKGE